MGEKKIESTGVRRSGKYIESERERGSRGEEKKGKWGLPAVSQVPNTASFLNRASIRTRIQESLYASMVSPNRTTTWELSQLGRAKPCRPNPVSQITRKIPVTQLVIGVIRAGRLDGQLEMGQVRNDTTEWKLVSELSKAPKRQIEGAGITSIVGRFDVRAEDRCVSKSGMLRR